MSAKAKKPSSKQLAVLQTVRDGKYPGAGTSGAEWVGIQRTVRSCQERGWLSVDLKSLTVEGEKVLSGVEQALSLVPELAHTLGDCPDCYGQETSEGCLRCDGTGAICNVCGESSAACRQQS